MVKLNDALVGEIGPLVSLLGTIYMFGLLIGSLCGGYINDKFGRKKESLLKKKLQKKNCKQWLDN